EVTGCDERAVAAGAVAGAVLHAGAAQVHRVGPAVAVGVDRGGVDPAAGHHGRSAGDDHAIGVVVAHVAGRESARAGEHRILLVHAGGEQDVGALGLRVLSGHEARLVHGAVAALGLPGVQRRLVAVEVAAR